MGALRGADRVAPWVYRIARNVVNDFHRGASATAALTDDVAAREDTHHALRVRSGPWLEELIRQLPQPYREAVMLSEIEGLWQWEVADRLGVSLSAAKSRIQRGRALLKEALDRCCVFNFDTRGNLIDLDPKPDRPDCKSCDTLGQECT
jgi:RNA polymerase sigma-70 factor (ECF subfamily)